ncbi:MAG: hypothetical protein WAU86_12760 [Oricola sp.]
MPWTILDMKSLIIATFLLGVCLGIREASAVERDYPLFASAPELADMANDPLRLVPFLDTMATCAQAAIDEPELEFRACSFVSSETIDRNSYWIWNLSESGIVYRKADGAYRILSGVCIDDFCQAKECKVAEWPVLSCGDGRKREMSAPSFETLVIDGRTYTRSRR